MKAFLTEWLLRYGVNEDNDTGWSAWSDDAGEHSTLVITINTAVRAGYIQETPHRHKITPKGLKFIKEDE